jgi:transcriptional regulator GlxA family with amidase domain
MSPRHFARAFVAEIGSTPARFVEELRISLAKDLLRETQWTQDRIASRVGLGSVDTLQRAFARRRGVSPEVYRDSERRRRTG